MDLTNPTSTGFVDIGRYNHSLEVQLRLARCLHNPRRLVRIASRACSYERRAEFIQLVRTTQFFRQSRLNSGDSLRETHMPAALAEPPPSSASDSYDLCSLARQFLERHPHFRGRITNVNIEQQGRSLVLTGRLPTFYLKQLVQEAVRRVPGVQHVYNQIDVVSAHGVSSVRC